MVKLIRVKLNQVIFLDTDLIKSAITKQLRNVVPVDTKWRNMQVGEMADTKLASFTITHLVL